MNTNYYKFLVFIFAALLISCNNDDETGIKPSGISNIKTFPLPGKIGITWTRQDPVNFQYIKVAYFDHLTKKDVVVLSSQYTDTLIIEKTRAKYGDYEFTLQPFSSTKTGGEVSTVIGKSGAAPKRITIVSDTKIALTEGQLYTDAQEPSEGPIKDLIDGDTNTFFHAAWSVNFGPLPHYIVIDLGKKVQGFKFSYTTRNNGGAGNHPKRMTVYGTTEFDGKTYDVSNALKIAELSGLPKGAALPFNSESYILDKEIQYLWLQVDQTHGNTRYFALSEVSVNELNLKIIDPEAPDK